MEAPEVHPPHKPHGGGVHWAELLMSLTALLVSAISIKIALHHGEVMEKLVTANSIPHIEIRSSNAVENASGGYDPALRIELRNVGVGPADVRYVTIRRNGVYLRNTAALRAAAGVPPETDLNIMMNQSRRHFIPASQSSPLFTVWQEPGSEAAWSRLDGVRVQSEVEACYCSVFEECWIASSATDGKREVEACHVDERNVFVP